MGSSSSTQRVLTQEQQDIKYLGDRMPFGDAELYEVYRAYMARMKLLEQQSSESSSSSSSSSSFLTDIGIMIYENHNNNTTTTGSSIMHMVTENDIDERLVLLQAIEQRILLKNFGFRLYQTSFLIKEGGDEPSESDDDYSRLQKLEGFFNGLANSTRRGTNKSLLVLMNCCEHQHEVVEEEDDDPISSNGYDNFAYGGGGGGGGGTTVSSSSKKEKEKKYEIEPLELVTIGYRVALAAAFLQSTTSSSKNEDDEHQDISRFFPPSSTASSSQSSTSETNNDNDNNNNDKNDDDMSYNNDRGLLALANSLSDFASKRKQRLERTATLPTRVYVNYEDVQEWAEHIAPLFSSSLASFLHMIFFPFRRYPPTRSNFEYPDLTSFESSIFLNGNSSLLFNLACMSPALTGQYYRLYTAASDGLSFNRLQNALLGYGGPTLVIIQSEDSIFGAFTGSPWKESKDFYGNSDSFLFQLQPKTACYRPTGKDNKYMYCNSFARSRGYDKQAHGIGFGGTVDKPRLFLPESFDDCFAGTQDLTFENGLLLADKLSSSFVIDNLEVWGVGGTEVVNEALGARRRERDIRQANINKARKVDKAAFLDDFRSGLIESKAFAHRGQIRGRDEACIDDNDLHNYKLPK